MGAPIAFKTTRSAKIIADKKLGAFKRILIASQEKKLESTSKKKLSNNKK